MISSTSQKSSKSSFWYYLNPLATLTHFWQYRDLLYLLTQRNIVQRYKGTFLGLFWLIATPVMMLAVYLFAFAYIFKVRWAGSEFGDSKTAFALIMFAGIILFNIFSEITNTSAICVASIPSYVKKAIFPLETLPLANVLCVFFYGIAWCFILLISIWIFLHKIYVTALVLPIILVCLFFLCCGIAWFMSAIGVYVRDIVYVVSVLTQILFFATPICYSLEMVPERFRPLMYLNPLTILVSETQNTLILGQCLDWTLLGILTLVSLFVFQGGYFFFMKTKGWFADVL